MPSAGLQRLYERPATKTRAIEGMAIAYGAEGCLAKALAMLTSESRKSPGSDAIDSLQAGAALRMGLYDQALSLYLELSRKNPRSPDLYGLMGAAYPAKGEREKAVASFEQEKNIAPNDPASVAGLADLLRMAGRTAGAIAEYRNLLKPDPESATGMNNPAYLVAESGGNLDEAEALVKRALQRVPNEPSFTDTLYQEKDE
jgi:tetratricopeptide (TPR) repeat protein